MQLAHASIQVCTVGAPIQHQQPNVAGVQLAGCGGGCGAWGGDSRDLERGQLDGAALLRKLVALHPQAASAST